jgi:MATE family multidrug resistance protein
MFMVPLSVGYATSALVAQRIGAGDAADVRRLSWHGLQIAVAIAALMGAAVWLLRRPILHLYTGNAEVVAAALPLLAWVVGFHVADAAQAVASFVLRAHRIAVVPLVVHTVAVWGVGLGGGFWLAFHPAAPAALHGAVGFWAAATLGLLVSAFGMAGFMAWLLERQRRL